MHHCPSDTNRRALACMEPCTQQTFCLLATHLTLHIREGSQSDCISTTHAYVQSLKTTASKLGTAEQYPAEMQCLSAQKRDPWPQHCCSLQNTTKTSEPLPLWVDPSAHDPVHTSAIDVLDPSSAAAEPLGCKTDPNVPICNGKRNRRASEQASRLHSTAQHRTKHGATHSKQG